MDTLGIIEKEGYRREDLSKTDQKVMEWLDHLTDELDNLKNNLDFVDEEMGVCGEEPEELVGKLKREIAIKTIDKAVYWLELQKAEYQIAFAENNDEEENDEK